MHRFGLLALVGILLAGCSGGGRGTASVSGAVLYKGQPVDGAAVTFLPKDGTAESKSASGRTDTRGNFTLTTYFGPDEQPAGAMPGEYSVTVTKIDEPAGAYDPLKDPPLKNYVPEKYSTPQKSPLTATVASGKSNRFEFKLED